MSLNFIRVAGPSTPICSRTELQKTGPSWVPASITLESISMLNLIDDNHPDSRSICAAFLDFWDRPGFCQIRSRLDIRRSPTASVGTGAVSRARGFSSYFPALHLRGRTISQPIVWRNRLSFALQYHFLSTMLHSAYPLSPTCLFLL